MRPMRALATLLLLLQLALASHALWHRHPPEHHADSCAHHHHRGHNHPAHDHDHDSNNAAPPDDDCCGSCAICYLIHQPASNLLLPLPPRTHELIGIADDRLPALVHQAPQHHPSAIRGPPRSSAV